LLQLVAIARVRVACPVRRCRVAPQSIFPATLRAVNASRRTSAPASVSAKGVGLKPDPQNHRRPRLLWVGLQADTIRDAKGVGLKPDPQNHRRPRLLWVGLQADAFPSMQQNPSG
jgi:hypothetical protein